MYKEWKKSSGNKYKKKPKNKKQRTPNSGIFRFPLEMLKPEENLEAAACGTGQKPGAGCLGPPMSRTCVRNRGILKAGRCHMMNKKRAQRQP